jgi:uncharacterized protein
MIQAVQIYPLLIGLLVGALVALTGLGGGLLLLPLLILGLKVPAIVAVGTSAVFMFFTKIGAAGLHWRRGNVDWRLALAMACGSAPGALAGVALLAWLLAHYGAGVNEILRSAIGALLAIVAVATVLQERLKVHRNVSLRDRLPLWMNRYNGAVITGLVGGFLVGLTSVGSGSVIMILLLLFYNMPTPALVGTDIFHAVMLTGITGLAHLELGTVDGQLVAVLLVGALPGVLIGAGLSNRIPAVWTRRVLLAVVVLVGIKMI